MLTVQGILHASPIGLMLNHQRLGGLSRLQVNLEVVKKKTAEGDSDPVTLFIENTVEAATDAWKALQIRGTCCRIESSTLTSLHSIAEASLQGYEQRFE